jgi:peptidyl-prolyl cis-trans isomerase D
MLRSLRASAQGWLGRAIMAIVMGVLILSFAIWGIGDIFRGFRGNELARVGSVQIGADTFRNAYQLELQRLQRVERRNITNEEAHQWGLDREVLSRLIGEAVLDDQANRLGLAISDEDIRKAIVNDPNFKGLTGNFDRRVFDAFLREEGFTEKSYVRYMRAAYLRRQIGDALTAGMQLPKALVEAMFRFEMEQRGVDYIELPVTSVEPLPAPSEKQLESYFEANRQLYTVPEYRGLVVLTVSPEALAKPESISDADAQNRYEDVKNERFGAPEKREVEQILFTSEDDAKKARAELDAGKPFSELLKERNLTEKDASLGTVTRSGLVDKAVADAAFSLKEGEASQPVKAQFGTVIVRAGKILPSTLKPFSEVAPEIKREIALQRAKAEITKLHDAIEDQRTSGKTLAEAAQSAGLEVRTIAAIDALGNDPQGQQVKDIVNGPALLKAAFASDIGVDNDTLRLPGGGYQWFEVAKIDKAREKTLSEARADVEKAWREEETHKRLAAKTAELVKKLDAGESMASIAAAEGNLSVKHAGDVKRSGSGSLGPNAAGQIFKVGIHRAGSFEGEQGGRIVFQVTESMVPPFNPSAPELTVIKSQTQSSLSDDLMSQYLAKLEGDAGVKLNPKAFAAATGASQDSY